MSTIALSRRELELGQLPAICFCCGTGGAMRCLVSLPFTPAAHRFFVQPQDTHAVLMVGHAGGFLAPFVPLVMIRHLVVTRRLSIELPLCERHCRTATVYHPRLRMLALFTGLLGAGFTILAGLSLMSAVQAGINPVERFGIYWIHTGIAFICTIAALWIRARLHDGFLYLVSITDDELVLGGVPASLEERIKAEFDPEELI